MPPAVLLRFGDRSVPPALSDLPAHDIGSATDIDEVLPDEGRLLVAGGDAELSVVLTRLLRLERLDLEVAPLRRARLAGRARSGAARAVPLIRDETATVLVGKGLWLPPPGSGQIVGEGIVDDSVLFDGVVTALRIEPLDTAPGLRAAVDRGRWRRHRWVAGRAAQLGTTGARVVRDGVEIPRPVRRSTFYRHTVDWLRVG
ncbi:MAG: peptidase M50 [Mycobacterium sp.]|nr:peptidase M50 [Mycobacterium sp.]